jgi:hypothetical protein
MERVTIVAEGPRPLAAVMSQTGHMQAALDGAASGAITGLLLVFFVDLIGWMAPLASGLVLGIGGLVFGLIVGAVVGLIVQAFTDTRRATSTAAGFEAEHYSVMVDDVDADMAARLISRIW